MNNNLSNPPKNGFSSPPLHPFRRAVLRGLGIVLPPLLTIVIFVWVGNTVAVYLLDPLENIAERAIVFAIEDIRDANELSFQSDPTRETGVLREDGADSEQEYHRVGEQSYVPKKIYNRVREADVDDFPTTAKGMYGSYVRIVYLQRRFVIPVFLTGFVLLLYLLGRFLAAGAGKFFWGTFERGIHRLPVVRNVYSSVKQVTDFLFNEREVEYTRVVAVEYPRKGIWSLGMVTGESMIDIRCAANEPVLSVLVPTSPMPFTGFTVTVKKSETVDLNITIDQAFQFIVSCGVVVPVDQLSSLVDAEPTTGQSLESDQPPALEESSHGAG